MSKQVDFERKNGVVYVSRFSGGEDGMMIQLSTGKTNYWKDQKPFGSAVFTPDEVKDLQEKIGVGQQI